MHLVIMLASAFGAGLSAYALTHNLLIAIGMGLISVLVFLYIVRVSR